MVIFDILHLELRICPAIWRLTVSNHVTKDELADLCQWVYDEHKIIISKDTAVQSSSGKENKIGSSAWPGKTCGKIMQIYPQVMAKVRIKKKIKNLDKCTPLLGLFCHLDENFEGRGAMMATRTTSRNMPKMLAPCPKTW